MQRINLLCGGAPLSFLYCTDISAILPCISHKINTYCTDIGAKGVLCVDAAYEKALGQKIRELRMRRGFSQVQLSAQLQVSGCDITRSALAKIEAGQRHIYPDEIRALRSILNVPYEELLDLPAGGAG